VVGFLDNSPRLGEDILIDRLSLGGWPTREMNHLGCPIHARTFAWVGWELLNRVKMHLKKNR
jgi:hypothetical protein